MFKRIMDSIEVSRQKRKMNRAWRTLFFEQYLNRISIQYGYVNSVLLGKLDDSEHISGEISETHAPGLEIGPEEKDDNLNSEYLTRNFIHEHIFSHSLYGCKILEGHLADIVKEVEEEFNNPSPNIPQSVINSLRNATSINELYALSPTQFLKYVRQWYKQNNTWKEMEPVQAQTVFTIDRVMDDVNKVNIKRIFSSKCNLTVTRVIANPFTWRIDFSGQWPK